MTSEIFALKKMIISSSGHYHLAIPKNRPIARQKNKKENNFNSSGFDSAQPPSPRFNHHRQGSTTIAKLNPDRQGRRIVENGFFVVVVSTPLNHHRQDSSTIAKAQSPSPMKKNS